MPARKRTKRSAATATRAPRPFAFDERYYRRYYIDRRTRVATPAQTARLARFVLGYLAHLELPVRRVLDVGCGLGFWRRALERERPRARYVGVEHSSYLCERYGWEQGSVVDFRARTPFDLVVCQGVLQYVSDRDAARAIDNLAELSRGALYLEALTSEDVEHVCDRSRSDIDVYRRPASWYRKRLSRAFIDAGGGVFVKHDAPVALYALERR
jgi:SAM-dependent methyltransferase